MIVFILKFKKTGFLSIHQFIVHFDRVSKINKQREQHYLKKQQHKHFLLYEKWFEY